MTAKKAKAPQKKAPKAATGNVRALKAPVETQVETQATEVTEKIMTTTKATTANFENLTKDASALGQEQVEALTQAGSVFAKGVEDIMKTYVSISQDAAEKNAAALKTLMGCKTINDFSAAQTKLAQQQFEDFVAASTKLSELGLKVTTETLEPLNAQASKAIKKATDALAA